MHPLATAMISGLAFGAVAVGLMAPMSFPNKRAALAAAFASRFAIGFIVPLVALPVPGFVTGASIGLLISLPDAITPKAYAPILIVGVLGGAIIGFIAGNAAI